MAFDPDAYWIANGPYLAPPGADSDDQLAVKVVLRDVLNSLGTVKDVLEVGCGRGRIAALLGEVLPKAKYAAVDFGPQVAATKQVRPDGTFYESRIQDFEPDRAWDLVLASEVLLHIPPADIQAVCDKLRRLARKWIVTVDWTEPIDGEIAEWNWLYNYRELFGSVERAEVIGLQSVFLIRP